MSGRKNHIKNSVKKAEAQDEAANEQAEALPEAEQLFDDKAEEVESESIEAISLSPEEAARLTQERDEYYDRLLRTQADFDNYRKRVQKDQANLLKYGAENALTEILPVVDNLERAADSARKHNDSDSRLREGIELILTQFRDVLGKLGVRPIESVGHPFDPNKHDALLRIHAPDTPDGAVVDEIRKGYYLHDKVLRPAQVTVGTHEPEDERGETSENA